jgi:predicted thioesterase
MSLVLHSQGTFARTGALELDLHEPVPVGAFVEVEADVEEGDGRTLGLVAAAFDPEDRARTFATARGRFVEAGAEG